MWIVVPIASCLYGTVGVLSNYTIMWQHIESIKIFTSLHHAPYRAAVRGYNILASLNQSLLGILNQLSVQLISNSSFHFTFYPLLICSAGCLLFVRIPVLNQSEQGKGFKYLSPQMYLWNYGIKITSVTLKNITPPIGFLTDVLVKLWNKGALNHSKNVTLL